MKKFFVVTCPSFWIEALLVMTIASCHTSAIQTKSAILQNRKVIPNDPDFSHQSRYAEVIHLPEAWSITTGSRNIVVAVIDSGKESHPDLDEHWLAGYDFFHGTADPTNSTGYHHGIHVAGIIAASGNNGIGIAGVCWDCLLMPILTESSSGNSTDPGFKENQQVIIARAIHYAIGDRVDDGAGHIVQANRSADGINISLGNLPGPCSPELQQALDAAYAAGVPVIAASSNAMADDRDASHYLWPTCSHVIVVTAVNAAGIAEPYATVGDGITLAAPGGAAKGPLGASAGYGAGFDGCANSGDGTGADGVASTWVTKAGIPCYRYWAGTSMAAPLVTGVVALLRSMNKTLTPEQIAQILKRTATPIACDGVSGHCGAGMLNAHHALQAGIMKEATTP